jgi:hypothetical protein
VEGRNLAKLREIDGDVNEFHAEDSYRDEMPSADILNALESASPGVLKFKLNCPVVLTHVQNSQSWHRGAEGRVVGFEPDFPHHPRVRLLNGVERIVRPEVIPGWMVDGDYPVAWRRQLPLALGWAMTLHKAEGQTLQNVGVKVIDAFEPGMGYVAMSRVSNREGLRILDDLGSMSEKEILWWIQTKLCRASQKALEFHLKTLSTARREMVVAGREQFQAQIREQRSEVDSPRKQLSGSYSA